MGDRRVFLIMNGGTKQSFPLWSNLTLLQCTGTRTCLEDNISLNFTTLNPIIVKVDVKPDSKWLW